MEIRAAVLREMGLSAPYADSRPLEIASVQLDPPGFDEVLVQIKVSGLCHSDLSVINGDRPRVMPMVLGHESSAEVIEVGPGVSHLAPGDHVVLVFVPSCGSCGPCNQARPALCEPGAAANTQGTLLRGSRRLHQNNVYFNHHVGVSCFADHAVVSSKSCVKITQNISHREAALFGCAVLTGAGAVINRARMRMGDSAAIVGLGGVGLSALLAAVGSGARRVIAVDPSEEKLQLARKLGATHTINPTTVRTPAELLEQAGGPVDFGFDMAGAVSSFETAFQLTKRGGSTVTSGLPNHQSRFALSISQLVAEERDIRGSYLGSGVPASDINRYIELYLEGRMPVDKLMGQSFALEDINTAFDHLASGSGLRDCIVF